MCSNSAHSRRVLTLGLGKSGPKKYAFNWKTVTFDIGYRAVSWSPWGFTVISTTQFATAGRPNATVFATSMPRHRHTLSVRPDSEGITPMRIHTRTLSLVLASAAPLAQAGVAGAVAVDFGDQGNLTPGNYNNVDHIQNPIFNMVDLNGNGTGYTLTINDTFWPGSNQSGAAVTGGGAAGIPGAASGDNLFGSLTDFGGFTEPTGGFVIGGLDATGATGYDFLFFGSRMNVGDNRETMYTATGSNSGFTLLDTANNTDNVALLTGIRADANGEITISVTAGPNNTNSNGFYYLGYMEMATVPAPAGSALLLGLGALLGPRRRR